MSVPVIVRGSLGESEMLCVSCDARSFLECKAEAQRCGGWGADAWFVWLVQSPQRCGRWCDPQPQREFGGADEAMADRVYAPPTGLVEELRV